MESGRWISSFESLTRFEELEFKLKVVDRDFQEPRLNWNFIDLERSNLKMFENWFVEIEVKVRDE